MRRLAPTAVLVLTLALGAVACGGEEDLAASGPGAAEVRLLENLYDGRFGRVWNALHPRHQQVVSRRRFAQCAQQVTDVGQLEAIDVLDVFDDDTRLPLLPDASSRAVRVRVTSASGESFVDVDHFVRVGGTWRWVLSQNAIDAYRRGRCPR